MWHWRVQSQLQWPQPVCTCTFATLIKKYHVNFSVAPMRTTLKVLMGISRPILYYLLSTYSFVLFFYLANKYFPVLFCSVLFCSVLFCSVLFCSVLFCSVLFCSVLFCSVLFCSVLFCSVLFCSVLFCSVLFCSYRPCCYNLIVCTCTYENKKTSSFWLDNIFILCEHDHRL